MKIVISDGGRSKYFKGRVGDCVCRAICNATGKDYKEVYDRLNILENEIPLKKREKRGSARNGIRKSVDRYYIEKELGLKWIPCMKIGSGCKVHLRDNEIPMDKIIICEVSHHLTCVKNGIIYDTYDCSRDSNRCVYGYWIVE